MNASIIKLNALYRRNTAFSYMT